MGIQKEHHQNLAQITHGYNLDFFNEEALGWGQGAGGNDP
jgi:hypothetical protein